MPQRAAAVCLAMLVAVPLAAAGESSLEALGWMVGSWSGEEGEVASEEVWIEPRGGIMLGLHRDVGPGGSAFFEFLRIEDRDGLLVFVAQPSGRAPTEFAAREVGSDRVVFENPEHDFPQRIVYERGADGTLVARVEGEAGGETRAAEWRWKRDE